MAEDAAEEERHPSSSPPRAWPTSRPKPDRTRDHRKLPHPHLPAQRARPGAADRQDLSHASVSTIVRSKCWAAPRPSATITASRAAAIACSNLACRKWRWRSSPLPPSPDQNAITAHLRRAPAARSFAEAWLRHKGLDWAADMIANHQNGDILHESHMFAPALAGVVLVALLAVPAQAQFGSAASSSTRPTIRRTC